MVELMNAKVQRRYLIVAQVQILQPKGGWRECSFFHSTNSALRNFEVVDLHLRHGEQADWLFAILNDQLVDETGVGLEVLDDLAVN